MTKPTWMSTEISSFTCPNGSPSTLQLPSHLQAIPPTSVDGFLPCTLVKKVDLQKPSLFHIPCTICQKVPLVLPAKYISNLLIAPPYLLSSKSEATLPLIWIPKAAYSLPLPWPVLSCQPLYRSQQLLITAEVKGTQLIWPCIIWAQLLL